MDKNYVVTKSNKLITCNYDLSVQEQKIILTLASMVQPQDENFKPYVFKIKDFMELLGIKDKTKYTEIPKITKELMQKVFEIKQGNKITQLAWLSSAEYEKGTGKVELEFSPKLKPYMLGLKDFYTSYRLDNVLILKSKYSIRLYEILKSNLFKKCIEIELGELKNMVGANANYLKVYADFKNKVLIQARKELKDKTDINFIFEEIKTGRKVTSIKFIITSNAKVIDEIAITSKEIETQPRKDLKLVKQVQAIFNKHKITDREAAAVLNDADNNIDFIKQCYDYLLTKDKINNVVGYMRKLVKCYNEPQSNIKVDSFNDYPQRNYDFKELEKKLLGWDNRTDEETENNNTEI